MSIKRTVFMRITVLALALLIGFAAARLLGHGGSMPSSATEGVLCVLRTPPGAGHWEESFTSSETLDRVFVAVQTPKPNQHVKFALSSPADDLVRMETSSPKRTLRFTCGKNVAPGTLTLTVDQSPESAGAAYYISDRPVGFTGWQLLSRGALVLVVLTGLVAWTTRRHSTSLLRRAAARAFECLLLGCVLVVLYLLLHEGGHALAAAAFGHFNPGGSDFLGLSGGPHAGIKDPGGLLPWQNAVVFMAGPAFPAITGWLFFLWWRSMQARRLRERYRLVDLYASAVCAMQVFSFTIIMPLNMIGLTSDGDWRVFIGNVSGPKWLIYATLAAASLVSLFVLAKTGPHALKLLRTTGQSVDKRVASLCQ